ncbi:sensor histidine kinase [Isoptericola cucumis]|uniref:histidine kinase n=1 Tax=Isoptericola cucumis TaxID=1776856 RepID=A0ABQ2BAJ7_9MICO|nr:ATP-binding protein [Isoptericola cucumis]GGI09430.1 histidine kinase [Isoptericola cucumis]
MRSWSIAVRVLALLLALAVLAGLALSALLYVQAQRAAEQTATAESRALVVAIADDPTVRAAAVGADPVGDLRGLTNELLADSGADFITIMAPDGTRWTHPDPDEVGGTYLGTRAPALAGRVYSETFTGTLGPSVRTIAPVHDGSGRVRGLVAAGITVENVSLDATRDLPLVLGLGAGVLLVGAGCAVALGRYLRRITLGLGPTELRQVHDLYDAALHNADEGLVLVDARGNVQLVNDRAGELLGLAADVGQALPQPVATLGMPESVEQVVTSGRTVDAEHHVTPDRTLVVSQRPASTGRVLLVRDSTELMHLSGQLRSTQAMATALRAQTHEHANRLHTVVSLLELGRADEARRFAAGDLARTRRLAGGAVTAVDEPFVSALLVSKSAEARDRGVRVEVVVAGQVAGLHLPSADLVTVVGNLVDNAVDAAEGSEEATVEVELSRIPSGLRIRVADTGPGLGGPDGVRSPVALFALGRTGKAAGPEGRGLGLALVRHTVQRLGGTVEAYDDDGAVFVVELPPGEDAGR